MNACGLLLSFGYIYKEKPAVSLCIGLLYGFYIYSQAGAPGAGLVVWERPGSVQGGWVAAERGNLPTACPKLVSVRGPAK